LGEPQLVFNYVRAMSDFTTNFVFGRGVGFRSDDSTQAILPTRLQRIWEVDNKKDSLLWQIGQMGSVCGDVFCKVAYEEPWQDPSGMPHPGRVRILPLNSAHCFPEWHPHDRERMIRFKLKYRFWGTTIEGTRQVFCTDSNTEILTKRGWLRHAQIQADDETLGMDPVTKVLTWQPILSVHRFQYQGDLVHWQNSHGFDALTTPNHRWLTLHRDRDGYSHWDAPGRFMTTEELSGGNKQIITAGGIPQCFAAHPTFSDEFVELVGWAVTEGHYQKPPARTGVVIAQSVTANPEKVARIRALVKYFADQGASAREMDTHRSGRHVGARDFYFGRGIGEHLRRVAPNKRLTPEFLCALTEPQARLLYETLLDSDGHRGALRSDDGYNRTVQTETFIQKDSDGHGTLTDDFQMLASMLGKRCATKPHSTHPDIYTTTVYARPVITARHLRDHRVNYNGIVWCPRTPSGTWVARRNDCVYITGNTYTELLTDTAIEEYVNDELIAQYPNPLGEIPIVHISNLPAGSSPWGMSDINDIVTINREYNEKCSDVSDIINYHAAPVTVITGARASNLEMGAKQTWSIPNKDAKVTSLLFDPQGVEAALKYLEVIKRSMHEMTGIPVTALGEEQAISNTSGVALAIQYQPLMQRFRLKATQYGEGIARINRLALKTLFMKEPQTLMYDPTIDPPPREDALLQLDPMDPVSYENTCVFQPPLPVDQLVKLNELQAKMALGLESKRGALVELGEEFPDEKLEELFKELLDDAEQQAALDYLKAEVAAITMSETGMVPTAAGVPEPVPPPPANGNGNGKSKNGGTKSAGGPGVTGAGAPGQAPGILPGIRIKDAEDVKKMGQRIIQLAHGTTLPQRRVPEEDQLK
jgi:hypothetical protein